MLFAVAELLVLLCSNLTEVLAPSDIFSVCLTVCRRDKRRQAFKRTKSSSK